MAPRGNAKMVAERTFLTKLLEAALAGDFEDLKKQVGNYRRENGDMAASEIMEQFKDGMQRTALHFACQSTPESVDESGDTDIVSQIVLSDWLPVETVEQILRQKDEDGRTPIMLAAMNKNCKLAERRVRALLKAGERSSSPVKKMDKLTLARSKAGATALHYASGFGGTAETIRLLYEFGPEDLNAFSLKGGAPLHWAAAAAPGVDHTETISELLKSGADFNGNAAKSENKDSEFTPPPLVIAAASGNDLNAMHMIKEANEKKIDITPTLKFLLPGNLTVLHILADMNLAGAIKMLLETHDIEEYRVLKSEEGFTPLELAARAGHVVTVMLLLPGESTEETAKKFIENVQANLPAEKTVVEENRSGKAKSKEKATLLHSEDPIEKEAGMKANEILSRHDEVSAEDKARALELKAAGNKHFVKNEPERAIEFYTRAIELDPTDAIFYSNRSACHMMLNKPEDALYDAVITRSFRPKWSKACFRMAVARFALDRYEDAAVAAYEGLEGNEDNDELRSLLQKSIKKGRQAYQKSG